MNTIAILFTIANVIALLLLPRRWASVPLLLGACYMTLGQSLDVGPFHFTVIRVLVVAGIVRIAARGERLVGGMNRLDWLMVAWAIWALVSSIFHENIGESLVFRLGLVYNACGIYFLLRVYCQSLDEVVTLCAITAILLVPLAVEMIIEKHTLHNFFSALGGVPDSPAIREGRVRAQGPFAHSILAGTVGAVCFPLAITLWRQHKGIAKIGMAACLIMIFAAASSGPVVSLMAGAGALMMWRYRYRMRIFRWLAIFLYLVLDMVMRAPAYYLIARIDLAGGSTGWHRARLIQSALQFLNEWWLAGTDYTRHWMPTGVSWSPNHTDITNYYIKMGVIGGLPLMLLFIAVLVKAFSFVGRVQKLNPSLPVQKRFLFWALGASLFAHAATFIAVSYFDQSVVFLYLTLAAIGSAWSGTMREIKRPSKPLIESAS